MTTILLIRHGENDSMKKGLLTCRTPGVHLNEKGRAQAEATAQKLKGAPVKAIYSSPMERAVETAVPIARALGLEIIVRQALIETDGGEWTGQSLKKLSRLKAWRIVQSSPAVFRFPGGESFAEIQRRICVELEALCAGRDPKDMLICVSHADPIKLALAYYLGLPIDCFQRLVISPAAISVLELGEMGGRLLAMNVDPSLNYSQP